MSPRPVPIRVERDAAPMAARRDPLPPLLPHDRLEWVPAWGGATRTMAHVYRPSTVDGIREVYDTARRSGRTIAFRGGGRSYGDAFQNREEIVLDLSRMNRILEYDRESGIVTCEPGVRLADDVAPQVGDGWWPPVVSGTMFTTLGGCASMNIHGKNAYAVGPFGNHIKSFDILLPSGELRTVSRTTDRDLFRGAIGGFGMFGAFTKITLKLKRIHSGNIRVFPKRVSNFFEATEAFDENAARMDYMVGWSDCFPQKKGNIGRGEMHFAKQLSEGEDAAPAQTMRTVNQALPDNILGILPKGILWRFAKPFVNNLGFRLINAAKYAAQFRPGGSKPYLQSHAAFHFLLDFVPDWKRCYQPGGLIQYQSFVPKERAAEIFTRQIQLCAKRGIYSYLGVTKKHIPDDYLITHAVDGFSLALDFPVTARNRKGLWSLCHEMDEMVLDAGGRFYFAKDSTMREGTARRYLPEENIRVFESLKAQHDPEGLFATNLYRRIFGVPSPGETARARNAESA